MDVRLLPNLLLPVIAAALSLCACEKKADPATEAVQLEKKFSETNPFVTGAVSAMRTNDFPAAVLALENARTMPGISPEQSLALERAKQAMTADLLRRAESGDAKARADLAALERSRSQ